MKTVPRSASAKSPAKPERSHKAFAEPARVVTDPALSTHAKRAALNSLEQDAKQLAVASTEGMSGGEPSNLREVMEAKRSLDLTSVDAAFATVLRTFKARARETPGTDTYVLITRAVEAINAARTAIDNPATAPATPPGAPEPGSTEELNEELEKEKLDPGA